MINIPLDGKYVCLRATNIASRTPNRFLGIPDVDQTIKIWLDENCIDKWKFDIINLRPDGAIFFENSNDAILFEVMMNFHIKNKTTICCLN